ncbi:hypothetical protein HNR44_001616 [Geomicrobium halophilum]|uniref:DUF4870 domain-containing protein n=1 Tax=Geomicrobium halophilum TaxID=549000 RepID=A0A841Q1D6_9BACL|nr:DUF4870 domain-containing protein [Geomicrobium halophilum]MBB6449638.1 hypothetical protein [Geomicrobium halophilum]
MATREQRNFAMFSHLIALSGLIVPLGSIIGPLVLWLFKKGESEFIDFHGKQSLNFQISIGIYMLISAILSFVLIGFFLIVAVAIVWLIFTIIATVQASNGERYRYPLSIPFIK